MLHHDPHHDELDCYAAGISRLDRLHAESECVERFRGHA